MLKRFNRLIAVIILIALSLYVVMLNKDPVTVRLSPGGEIHTSLGVSMIAVFCLGILLTALVTLILGFRGYFRERALRLARQERENFFSQLVKARSLQAAGNLSRAKTIWEQLLKREPKNVVAQVELARSLREGGQSLDAIGILDKARRSNPDNIEVLFEAAEAHLAAGNKTAAVDNLALVLSKEPCIKAARKARDLSEEIGGFERAAEYQSLLEKLGERSDAQEANERIELGRLFRDNRDNKTGLIDALRSYVRRHSENSHALTALADLEQEAGNLDEAAELLMRAARTSGNRRAWRRAVELWISRSAPDRALAAARAATKEMAGKARVLAALDLVDLLLNLGILDEAEQILARLPQTAEQEGSKIECRVLERYDLLKALLTLMKGNPAAAEAKIKELLKGAHSEQDLTSRQLERAPSPSLSHT